MAERGERCEGCRFWEREKMRPLSDTEDYVRKELAWHREYRPEDFEVSGEQSQEEIDEYEQQLAEDIGQQFRQGFCRCRAPQMIVWPGRGEECSTCEARWPLTQPEDWCGEFERREPQVGEVLRREDVDVYLGPA